MEEQKINLQEYWERGKAELLKDFAAEFPEKSEEELIDFAPRYYAAKATEEMNKLFEENGWGDEKIEEWSKAHFRTPYKKL